MELVPQDEVAALTLKDMITLLQIRSFLSFFLLLLKVPSHKLALSTLDWKCCRGWKATNKVFISLLT